MITSLCFLSNEADPNHSEKSARSSGQMMTGDGFLSAENSLIFFPLSPALKEVLVLFVFIALRGVSPKF